MALGCPAYIGRIGDMLPTPCMADVQPASEQRVVMGGGEGTLAPRWARVYGPGARTWPVSREGWLPHENSVVTSLVRTQAIRGGAYRVIPCDAVDHNMMTPQASEELDGWEGVHWSWRASFPEVEGAWADSVIPLTIPFIIGGTGGLMAAGPRPAGLGKVAAGQTATSPLLPVVRPEAEAFASVYVAGTGTLRVRAYNGAGASTAYARAFSGVVGVLQRITLPHTVDASRVSARIEVAATSDVHMAWPSYAYADNPYVTGRGCDQALLKLLDRNARSGDNEALSYEIMEVGV